MPNDLDAKKDAEKDRNITRALHDQIDIARAEGKMNAPNVHFSTWLIDTFAHGSNTPGLLVIFPFEVSKKDEKRKRFEEAVQRAFREVYLP